METPSLKRTSALALALLAGIAGTASATPASQAHTEITTAVIHATVATKMDSLAAVHLHLHHVINCLVGEHGEGWDAKAEAVSANKCEGLGNGAIPDSKTDPAIHGPAERALAAATAGVAADSVAAGHADAHKALAALDEAAKAP